MLKKVLDEIYLWLMWKSINRWTYSTEALIRETREAFIYEHMLHKISFKVSHVIKYTGCLIVNYL